LPADIEKKLRKLGVTEERLNNSLFVASIRAAGARMKWDALRHGYRALLDAGEKHYNMVTDTRRLRLSPTTNAPEWNDEQEKKWHTICLIPNIKKGDLPWVKMNLEGGADPNTKNGKALETAIRECRSDIVDLLLAAKADPHAGDNRALEAVTETRQWDIAAKLLASDPVPANWPSEYLNTVPVNVRHRVFTPKTKTPKPEMP
ncbi:MAG: hypothetical protein U9N14_00935, partial [Pseudomonadota bacterium]|nr:hypothetical protein [Pseudomonadota bacterium]